MVYKQSHSLIYSKTKNSKGKIKTYRWGLNIRFILETCSFSQSRSSSPWSILNFLLQGPTRGGPVLWLVTTEDTGDCILGSPLRAASPRKKAEVQSFFVAAVKKEKGQMF